jgi:virginiamycin A acetyltransferase
MNRPNPNEVFPNPNLPRLCFIKNVVKNPRIIIGDYTYYDDVDGADQFEKHVTHFYDFIGDKLIIGKFCAIAKGVEFVMNGANHKMSGTCPLTGLIALSSSINFFASSILQINHFGGTCYA